MSKLYAAVNDNQDEFSTFHEEEKVEVIQYYHPQSIKVKSGDYLTLWVEEYHLNFKTPAEKLAFSLLKLKRTCIEK